MSEYNDKLKIALDNIDLTYKNVIGVANDIQSKVTSEVDALVQTAYNKIENLSNDDLRSLILKIALASYSFGDIKEKSIFKASLAKTLRDEAKARVAQEISGTVAAKDQAATLAISAEIIAEEIYSLVASLLKTKADEIHRVVDSLKTVLNTRLTEIKLSGIEG